jgi:DNA-binding MarR family transcriptional regulator
MASRGSTARPRGTRGKAANAAPLQSHLETGALLDEYKRHYRVRMIAQFEREGLIRRLSSSTDRRASIIRITPKGEVVLGQMRELTTRVRKEFLGELSVDEVRRMLDMLEHMLSFLKV